MKNFTVELINFTSMDFSCSLFQSGFWGYFKSHMERDAMAFVVKYKGIVFPLVVVQRRLSGEHTYSYAPRGPQINLPEEDQGPFLEELSRRLAPYVPSHSLFIRYDTVWETPYLDRDFFTEKKQWKGPPRSKLRELRMNYFTEEKKLYKSAMDLLPPDTVFVDLTEDEDTVFYRMRQNTRNCIRRSFSKGVEIHDASPKYLPLWYDLYYETACRKDFTPHEYGYFEALFTMADKYGKRVSDESKVPDFRLLIASVGDEIAAGMILGILGRNAYYLFAGSSTAKRECMPNYRLQWEAIEIAKNAGCRTYDLFGIPPNNHSGHSQKGLYTFKTGLGGKVIHYRGCWDYPLKEGEYLEVRNIELAV